MKEMTTKPERSIPDFTAAVCRSLLRVHTYSNPY